MVNYKDVIKEFLIPQDKLGSVIDTFNTIGEILETRQKVKDGTFNGTDDVDAIILRSMYVLGFYPFYNAHGAVLRPILINALEKDDPIKAFFVDAIPTALTIAVPYKPEIYKPTRDKVIAKFES